jgi:large subunit ribosomal protein L15
MPHRLRKVRKQRGSRTHGWGQVGQHRGIGMRGGHGKAGRKKHKWTYVLKHEPNYFGKHGFKRAWVPQSKTMNVGDLDERVELFLGTGVAEKVANGVAINLTDLGVDKLLGSGQVTRPLVVYAQSWSEAAAQKIERAGGQILAPADEAVAETDGEA